MMKDLSGVVNRNGSQHYNASQSHRSDNSSFNGKVSGDMQKLYNLTRGINLMMHSKKLVECLLFMLETFKHTYP